MQRFPVHKISPQSCSKTEWNWSPDLLKGFVEVVNVQKRWVEIVFDSIFWNTWCRVHSGCKYSTTNTYDLCSFFIERCILLSLMHLFPSQSWLLPKLQLHLYYLTKVWREVLNELDDRNWGNITGAPLLLNWCGFCCDPLFILMASLVPK